MLFIDNRAVEAVLTMADCIAVQTDALRALESGGAMSRPRIDFYAPCALEDGYWRWATMEGAHDGIFAIRMMSDVITWPRAAEGGWTEENHCVAPGTWCGLLMLLSTANGEPLAFINDGYLQHMRVGGGAGIGTRALAREDAATVGMLGSGGMARSFLDAFAVVRDIRSVKVYSPTRANRERYADEMAARLGIPVEPVASAREAVKGADILSSCTDSMHPTIEPDWIEPGMHVVAVGPAEISREVMDRFDVRIAQGPQGLGDLPLAEGGRVRSGIGMSPIAYIAGTEAEMERLPPPRGAPWFRGAIATYGDLISGRAKGRERAAQVTYYQNGGIPGLLFAAVGGLVYRKAKGAGLGNEIPTGWFLQDVRN